MQLLRCLFFLEAAFQFKLTADDLSRIRLSSFLSKRHTGTPQPFIPRNRYCYWILQSNNLFRANFICWRTFLTSWNRVHVFRPFVTPQISFVSHVSWQWVVGRGMGPSGSNTSGRGALPYCLPGACSRPLACAAWGLEWCGCTVLCWCDEAAVHDIAAWSRHNKSMMQLLRCLFFLEAAF